MGQNLLIAESCELLRVGLKTIFVEDMRVAKVHEAANIESLKTQLRTCSFDLIVVNQSLVTDIMGLPRGNFVILTAEPDMTILKAAYKHGGRGYLSENVSAELLRTVLYSSENSFLIEPALMPWVMGCVFGDAFSSIREDLLTPREKEIVSLLRGGLDRARIAKHLCIAETTLKTHIKNIARKRERERTTVASY